MLVTCRQRLLGARIERDLSRSASPRGSGAASATCRPRPGATPAANHPRVAFHQQAAVGRRRQQFEPLHRPQPQHFAQRAIRAQPIQRIVVALETCQRDDAALRIQRHVVDPARVLAQWRAPACASIRTTRQRSPLPMRTRARPAAPRPVATDRVSSRRRRSLPPSGRHAGAGRRCRPWSANAARAGTANARRATTSALLGLGAADQHAALPPVRQRQPSASPSVSRWVNTTVADRRAARRPGCGSRKAVRGGRGARNARCG